MAEEKLKPIHPGEVLLNETFILNENRLFAPVYVGQTSGYAHLDTGARHSSILQAYSGQFPSVGSRELPGDRSDTCCIDGESKR